MNKKTSTKKSLQKRKKIRLRSNKKILKRGKSKKSNKLTLPQIRTISNKHLITKKNKKNIVNIF